VATRNPQSTAKRAREQAVKERRDRKRERKAEVAAKRVAANHTGLADVGNDGMPHPPTNPQSPTTA
jgi:hypothetical protein